MYKRAVVCRKIRKLIEGGMRYSEACTKVVRTRQTIVNWRLKKPLIDRYFLTLIHGQEEKEVDVVENVLYDRLTNGKATPTEFIFYLCNRKAHKWKRQDGTEVHINQTMNYLNAIASKPIPKNIREHVNC